jgi:hypothetical protein
MESIQSKLEAELLKMKEENILTIGKKVIPDIAKRLADKCMPSAPWVSEIPEGMVDEFVKGRHDLIHTVNFVNSEPNTVFLAVLEKIKERIGSIPVWRIPEDEYLAIVEECRKETNGAA